MIDEIQPCQKQVRLLCPLFAKRRMKRKIAQTKSKDIVAFIPKDSALKFVSIVLRYNAHIDRCPSGRRSTPGTRVRCKPSGVRIPFCLPFLTFSSSFSRTPCAPCRDSPIKIATKTRAHLSNTATLALSYTRFFAALQPLPTRIDFFLPLLDDVLISLCE